MALLSRLGLGSRGRSARTRAALGQGVWRRAHDRFRRAVDRYHQMIEGVPDGPVRDRLEADGARLAAALDGVRVTCVAAQAASPSDGLDVPGGRLGGVDLRDVHRDLSRAAGLAAQAAEAAAMVRVAAPAGDGADVDSAGGDGAVVDGAVVDGAVVDGAVVDGAVMDGAGGSAQEQALAAVSRAVQRAARSVPAPGAPGPAAPGD